MNDLHQAWKDKEAASKEADTELAIFLRSIQSGERLVCRWDNGQTWESLDNGDSWHMVSGPEAA